MKARKRGRRGLAFLLAFALVFTTFVSDLSVANAQENVNTESSEEESSKETADKPEKEEKKQEPEKKEAPKNEENKADSEKPANEPKPEKQPEEAEEAKKDSEPTKTETIVKDSGSESVETKTEEKAEMPNADSSSKKETEPEKKDEAGEKAEKYTVRFKVNNAEAGTIIVDGSSINAGSYKKDVEEGKDFKFSVTAKEGFEVGSVKVNGANAEKNGSTGYIVRGIKDNTEIAVQYKSVQTEVEKEETPETESEKKETPEVVKRFLDAVKKLTALGGVTGENAERLNELGQAAMDAYEAVQDAGLEDYEGVQDALDALMAIADKITGGVQSTALIKGEQFTVRVVKVVNNQAVETVQLTSTCLQSTGHSGYTHSTNLRNLANQSGFSGYKGYNWSQYTTVPSTYTSGLCPNNNYASVHYNITGSAPYKANETLFLFFETARTFTLKYDANDGTGAPAQQSATSTATSYNFTISNTQPTRDEYDFLGWSTNKLASSPSYYGGGTINVISTTTLYAVWQKKAPVDNGNGISIEKRRESINGDENKTTAEEGDVIKWSIIVTNESNVNKTVTITEKLIGVTLSEKVVELAPGESKTVIATYTVTEEDSGMLYNTAVASTGDPGDREEQEDTDIGTEIKNPEDDTYTVIYKDSEEYGGQEFAEHTGLKAGDQTPLYDSSWFTDKDKDFWMWTPAWENIVGGTNHTIIYTAVYKENEKYPLTIHYQWAGSTESAAPDYTDILARGDSYEVESPVLDVPFEYAVNYPVIKGTVGGSTHDIKYWVTYTPKVKIQHIYRVNGEVVGEVWDTITKQVSFGNTLTETAYGITKKPSYDGKTYTYSSTDTVTLPGGPSQLTEQPVLKLYYDRTEKETHKLIVHFKWDGTDVTAAEDYVKEYEEGSSYFYDAPTSLEASFDNVVIPKAILGTMGKEDVEETVTYSPQYKMQYILRENGKVKYKGYYNQGNAYTGSFGKSYTVNGMIGRPYADDPVWGLYICTKVENAVFPADPSKLNETPVLTLYFDKNDPVKETVTITVRYIYTDENGNETELKENVEIPVTKGEDYDVSDQVPDTLTKDGQSYKQDSVEGDLKGTADKNTTITVKYVSDTPEESENPIPIPTPTPTPDPIPTPTPDPTVPEETEPDAITPTPAAVTPATTTPVPTTPTPTTPAPAALTPLTAVDDAQVPLAAQPEVAVEPLQQVGDGEVPLAAGPHNHKCCILHFLIMLLALIVELFYTKSMKKHQKKIFEARREITDFDIEHASKAA